MTFAGECPAKPKRFVCLWVASEHNSRRDGPCCNPLCLAWVGIGSAWDQVDQLVWPKMDQHCKGKSTNEKQPNPTTAQQSRRRGFHNASVRLAKAWLFVTQRLCISKAADPTTHWYFARTEAILDYLTLLVAYKMTSAQA